mgnify:FL=1
MSEDFTRLLDALVELAHELPLSHPWFRCRHVRFRLHGREPDCPCLRCGIDRVGNYLERLDRQEVLGKIACRHAKQIAKRFIPALSVNLDRIASPIVKI